MHPYHTFLQISREVLYHFLTIHPKSIFQVPQRQDLDLTVSQVFLLLQTHKRILVLKVFKVNQLFHL